MMEDNIKLNSDVCQILSAVPEKFVVDFANNITVAQDHERIQRTQKSFFQRLYSGATGQNWQRQHEVNSSIIKIAESQLIMLTDLNNSVALGFKAISKVTNRLNDLSTNVADIADFAVNTRTTLEQLNSQFSERFFQLEQRLARVELEASAAQQVSYVFNQWAAGHFQHLPVAGRAYAALEELNWGDYGRLIRTAEHHQLDRMLDGLSNRLMIQMREDTELCKNTRVDYRSWLRPESLLTQDYQYAIEYLAEDYQNTSAPFINSLFVGSQELPMAVPRICTAERLSDALVDEVFREAS
ncbi:diguanylate cyclase regulator RdcB family protein [Shewanella sp. S1-49-MNA-CIBAN-0167]|uniref:diguanylate cyclase regulator RdcB family protein n=1 Tax=Shewanella sp. S1-49-MNA-CIBAN-0167 TaxID=3140468 RepID=UPI0033326662